METLIRKKELVVLLIASRKKFESDFFLECVLFSLNSEILKMRTAFFSWGHYQGRGETLCHRNEHNTTNERHCEKNQQEKDKKKKDHKDSSYFNQEL